MTAGRESRTGRRQPATTVPRGVAAAALALLAIGLYLPTLHFGFVFDDASYITMNAHVKAGLSRESLAWAFTTTQGGHRHPLTWVSHLADVTLYGLRPAGHHLTNLLVNAANVVLLFLLLDMLTGRRGRAWAVAALFAVHPLHVESVAWVSDRKDLLAVFWSLVALLGWTRWARAGRASGYVLAIVAFALALASKEVVVTLPALMLIMDVWPLGRWRSGRAAQVPPGRASERRAGLARLIGEKAPFIALAAAMTLLGGRAVENADEYSLTPSPWPLGIQAANALVQYATYAIQTVWPHRLAVLYSYETHPDAMRVVASGMFLLAVSALAWRLRRNAPILAWGWIWFLALLVPVIGLIPGGPMARADRYMYLAIVGLLAPLVWGAAAGVERLAASSRARRRLCAVAAATAVAVFGTRSVIQGRSWRTNETLFSHAFEVNRQNPLAWHNLAVIAAGKGRIDEAIQLYRGALAIDPRFVGGHHNLGAHLASQGRFEEAIAEYRAALAVNPRSKQTLYDLAGALARMGRTDEAIVTYRRVLDIDPEFGPAHNNLGAMLLKRGNVEAAIAEYREALRITPTSAVAYNNLQQALALRRPGSGEGRQTPGAADSAVAVPAVSNPREGSDISP